MITPADSLGPPAIVRSTLLNRWPSVDTIRLLEPSLSKNTPFRWNRVSSLQIENIVRSIISRSTALSTEA
jgi:hypothetical protein